MMLVLLIMVVMMMICFIQQLFQRTVQCVLLRHGINQLPAGQLIPFGRDNRCIRIKSTNPLHGILNLFLRQAGGMAENQAACIRDLIIEKFAEIFLIHLALLRIDNRCKAVQFDIVRINIPDGIDDIAQLADAGRFNQNPVRRIFLQHLDQRFSEIAYE